MERLSYPSNVCVIDHYLGEEEWAECLEAIRMRDPRCRQRMRNEYLGNRRCRPPAGAFSALTSSMHAIIVGLQLRIDSRNFHAPYIRETLQSFSQLGAEGSPLDRLTPTERSERMSRIKGKNTKPELVVRRVIDEGCRALCRRGWPRDGGYLMMSRFECVGVSRGISKFGSWC